ncbi:MAG: hypothetical protein J5842_08130, partial [Lachnospiraceae bacterium]|nr:hypothetical protein [Lachnospiraceae bacterium]
MEEYKRDEGYKSVTHLMMLVSMTLLSGMLVIMNRVLMWEPWMIPVVIMGTAICWFLRISRRIGERAQIYFCGVFLMFEGFYYASNITTVYDCTAVFCVLIWLLAFTGESILLYSGLIVGMSGMLIHIYIYDMSSESFFSLSTIVRIAWQAAILIFSAILADRITKIWKNTE